MTTRQRGTDPVVVVFTRDLRLHDHPALSAACASGRTVVPLFVMEPSLTDLRSTSANRLAFLWESLADLRASLIRRGANLYVRRGDAVAETMRIVEQTGACSLFASEDVSRLARERQQRLERSVPARSAATSSSSRVSPSSLRVGSRPRAGTTTRSSLRTGPAGGWNPGGSRCGRPPTCAARGVWLRGVSRAPRGAPWARRRHTDPVAENRRAVLRRRAGCGTTWPGTPVRMTTWLPMAPPG